MIKDFQTRGNRLRRTDNGADFRLADNDDFFGFSSEELDARDSVLKNRLTVFFGIVVLVCLAWAVLGNVQQNCLERNGNDITKCD